MQNSIDWALLRSRFLKRATREERSTICLIVRVRDRPLEVHALGTTYVYQSAEHQLGASCRKDTLAPIILRLLSG